MPDKALLLQLGAWLQVSLGEPFGLAALAYQCADETPGQLVHVPVP